MLDAVLHRGETLDQAMGPATKGLANPSDRALAHNIAATALRWLGALDGLIDSATKKRLPDDAKARSVLRIALVQALLLNTPKHAAIATALPLVAGGPRRLVHGVFSTLMRRAESGEAALPASPPLPASVSKRWRKTWGQEMADAAQAAWTERPPLDLSLRDEDVTAPEGGILAPRHRRLTPDAAVTELPGFVEGGWWVQDLAASLPARLLGPGEGRTILDLCAAPGGKTMQLAAAGWTVTAVDNSKARMERLQENLQRTGLTAQCVIADLLDWEPDTQVDAILLDAPCTATGIFRRHPDVLHLVGERQIAERAELQERLLARAADWLKPGGMLVYAVCSLEPEEGERQIARFLAERSGFDLQPVRSDELPAIIAPTADGNIRTLPGMLREEGGLDGFFIARMHRLSSG